MRGGVWGGGLALSPVGVWEFFKKSLAIYMHFYPVTRPLSRIFV